MATSSDPFEVLGLEQGATRKEVRKRYRELARRYHPDVNEGDSTATWMFKQVSTAHNEIVGKPTETVVRPSGRATRPAKPPTEGWWTPPEPIDERGPWLMIGTITVALLAGQITGATADWTGFAEEVATILKTASGGRTTASHTKAATILATAITLATTVAVRHRAWQKTRQSLWRPAHQVLEALVVTTAAVMGGSTILIMIGRYAAQ